MQTISDLLLWLSRAVASQRFYRLVMAMLVLQAGWIALSSNYPMAFDEDFHLGVIRLYAHHLSPFWHNQPEQADMFGAVARDPSYLFHYLMSFPYRLVSLLTHSLTAQVLCLRFINIALLTSSLPLFRRLLLRLGLSRAASHVCLLIFAILPVVPLLAAQINYDNLLIPLTGLLLVWAIQISDQAKRHRLKLTSLIGFVAVALLTSLVKYAFLPLLMVLLAFVTVRLWQNHPVKLQLKRTRQQLGTWTGLGVSVALLVASGLFIERYGLNIWHYHTPAPDCGQVLSVEQCSEYGPWIRDYTLKNDKVSATPHNPIIFTQHWLYGMWLRTFFAVAGPNTTFETRGPLLVPGIMGALLAAVGTAFLVLSIVRLWRGQDRAVLALLLSACGFYIAILWLDEYRAFLRTGQPVAINGRYLFPIIIPAFGLIALSLQRFWQQRQRLKVGLISLAVLGLLWGGGAMTYVLRSNDAWLWPSPLVRHTNHAVQRVFGPITPGSTHPTQFLH